MEKNEIVRKLKSLKLCLEVHPDNEPNSEFEDRIADLNLIIAELETDLKMHRKGALDRADKEIYMVYKTDCHHSYASRELIGIATFKSIALNLCSEKAILENEIIDLDQLELLVSINQTQGYQGEGEFVIEPVEVNKLL